MNRWLVFGWFLVCASVGATAGELPDWLERWKVGGDLRLRYEGTEYDRDDARTRHRFRFRLRVGADITLSEALQVKFRLASGDGSPTSTNQTFDHSFENKDFFIERAYATYEKGSLSLGGGKVSNPFRTTDMVWDSDVAPEGFYQTVEKKRFFVTLGEMFLEEERANADTNLLALQVGTFGKAWSLSSAYYHYIDVALTPDIFIDYDFFDLLGTYSFEMGGLPGKLEAHFVRNVSDTVEDHDTAWAVYAEMGAKEPGKWRGHLKYAEIEANSIFGPFGDSDFGFTDREGWQLAATYQATKRVATKANLIMVDSIRAVDEGASLVQLDISIKF